MATATSVQFRRGFGLWIVGQTAGINSQDAADLADLGIIDIVDEFEVEVAPPRMRDRSNRGVREIVASRKDGLVFQPRDYPSGLRAAS